SWRRQTRSTAHRWAELLPDVDALLVMRRDEPGSAAAWYAQTGFADVLAVRCLYLDMDAAPEPAPATGAAGGGRYQVKVVTPADEQWQTSPWQGQMAGGCEEVYGATWGALRRQ